MRLRLISTDTRPLRSVIGTGFLVAGILTLALSALWVEEPPERPRRGATVAFLAPDLPPPWPLSLAARASRTVEGEFRRGDTFAGVLGRAGIPAELVAALTRAAEPDFNLRQIRAGRPYKLYFDAGDRLLVLRYQPDRQTAVLMAQGSDGWSVTRVTVPYEVRPRYLHASVRGSLEGALAGTWVGRRDAIDLAHKLADVFAWDIDFAADLRLGDTIDLLVEQRFLEDETAGFGDVLAADLRVNGHAYRAVRYERTGSGDAYFTPSGASLQRAFLRSPVKYTRISSGFSYRRLHPVLNVVRPHFGVDYVAPVGTPVHATAEGTVVYVGRTSQPGNHVKIRHGGSYTSWYLHLSRFAEALRIGDHVAQGQVIGYVGKTGLATSYHLDYRLERGGEFLDPLKIEFPSSEPLPASEMVDFSLQRNRWLGLLREGQRSATTVLAGSE